MPPLLIVVLDVTVLDVLPLAALVDAVPDPVRSGVECQLDTEGADKDGGQEDGIPLEEGVVEGGSEAGHCECAVGETSVCRRVVSCTEVVSQVNAGGRRRSESARSADLAAHLDCAARPLWPPSRPARRALPAATTFAGMMRL